MSFSYLLGIRESLIKSGRIILGYKMIKIKARNAGNSRAIAKFCNAEIDYFVPKMIVHDLIRGSPTIRVV